MNILAVVGEDMILDTDPLCDGNDTDKILPIYLYIKSSIQSLIHILSITSTKCGGIR
jgi:hypothetical protein